jgi:hypothetical protein
VKTWLLRRGTWLNTRCIHYSRLISGFQKIYCVLTLHAIGSRVRARMCLNLILDASPHFPQAPQSLLSRVGNVRRSYTTSNSSSLERSHSNEQTPQSITNVSESSCQVDLIKQKSGDRLLGKVGIKPSKPPQHHRNRCLPSSMPMLYLGCLSFAMGSFSRACGW